MDHVAIPCVVKCRSSGSPEYCVELTMCQSRVQYVVDHAAVRVLYRVDHIAIQIVVKCGSCGSPEYCIEWTMRQPRVQYCVDHVAVPRIV